jgi:hypothetical protein
VTPPSARVLDVPEMTPAAWFEYAERRGWGDGLPTLPPTVDAVERYLEEAGPVGDEIDPIPPAWVRPDVRSLAANAVMAGCTPAGFGIVVAALRAVLAEAFNPVGVLATTHPCTPLVVVNGTARSTGEVNAAYNCLGQGRRGNATIGRALHLVLVNLGGSLPGTLDRATHGSPAKYTYCFAENEEASPWPSLAVRRGFSVDESVVTVFAAEGPHNVNDHGSTSGVDVLRTIAGTMATPGSNNLYLAGEHLVVLGPEHAATLGRDGWDIPGMQEALHDLARVPATVVSAGKRAELAARGIEPSGGHYRLEGGPRAIQIVVAGGDGKHSAWVPTFGASRCVSASLTRKGETDV